MWDFSLGIDDIECIWSACSVASDIPSACWRSDWFSVQNVPKRCDFAKIAIFALWSGFAEPG